MSVNYITGDALDFPAGTNTLVHGTSLKGVLGAGFAKALLTRYPDCGEPYFEAFNHHALFLGGFVVAKMGEKRIVHLVTQADVGTDRRQVNYEALYSGLEELRNTLESAAKEGRKYSVVMPYIGCGLAGGSERIFKAIVEDIFEKSPIPVCIIRKL